MFLAVVKFVTVYRHPTTIITICSSHHSRLEQIRRSLPGSVSYSSRAMKKGESPLACRDDDDETRPYQKLRVDQSKVAEEALKRYSVKGMENKRNGSGVAIVWFRNDLRILDNEALYQAWKSSEAVLPVYCIDPRLLNGTTHYFGFPKTGELRAQFLLESLADLKKNLLNRGLNLLIKFGKPEEVLPAIVQSVGAHTVYAYKETCSEEVLVEKHVSKILETITLLSSGPTSSNPRHPTLQLVWGSTMYHLLDLPFKPEYIPDVYTEFRKSSQSAKSDLAISCQPHLHLFQIMRSMNLMGGARSLHLISLDCLPKIRPSDLDLKAAEAKLCRGFYKNSCPEAESLVTSVLLKAVQREPRNAASVLRLQFHDCFVNGCDGSVLLDDTSTMVGEKTARSNKNSLRAFDVIDEIKKALEEACPNTVSCADIIIMAARDAVVLTGGPSWEVLLGRRDSLTASLEDSNDIMPSARANATALIQRFKRFGLSVKDMVALSGSHTIGKARCFAIVHRLYNQSGTGEADPTIELRYKKYLDKLCPQSGDGNVTGNLDATPTVFDNQYFKDLVKGRGFLNSDEVLFSTGGETRQLVELFSKNQTAFFSSFTTSMINLGNLFSSHSLHCGEIRRDCRRVNSRTAAPPA